MNILDLEAEGEFDPEGLVDETFDEGVDSTVKGFVDGYHTNQRCWLATQATNTVFQS